MNRIAVFGTGYLGATHAAGMAELGHEVVGVDVDASKIERLARGEVPFYEPGLPEILERNVKSGQVRFTTDAAAAMEFADVVFIGVGTPQKPGEKAADLRYVEAVVETIGPLITKPTVVFGKSTVPVGTTERLARRLRELAPVPEHAEFGFNPEFLREGFAVKDTLTPDRIVLGVDPEHPGRIEEVARSVYRSIIDIPTPFLVTDVATAELVKVAANAFLATKISFINAMAEVCDATGADVADLADAIGLDERIGRKFLNAGLGFGGGCLPKDIRAFRARADELGLEKAFGFLREVDDINSRRRDLVVDLAREAFGGSLEGAAIAVLGAAFKPESDDIRDSPAVAVSRALHAAGAKVTVYDPQANETAAAVLPEVAYAASPTEAVTGASLVIVATEWREFREADPVALAAVATRPHVIDARNCLDVDAWRSAGWTYRGLGRHAT